MNEFYKDENSDNNKHSFIIHKNFKTNAENLEKEIRNLIPDSKNEDPLGYVYIYYLIDKTYNYPKEESDILYIGSTIGEKTGKGKSIAFRFKHLKDGKDYKQNITLKYFYEDGNVIGLDIFKVDDCRSKEKELRYMFLNKFGSLPIADGSSYSTEKSRFINISTDEALEGGQKE